MVISVTTHETVEYHSTTINGRTHTREEKTKIIVIEPMTDGGFKTGYRAPIVNEASSRGPASSDEVELAREVEMEDGSVRLVALLWVFMDLVVFWDEREIGNRFLTDVEPDASSSAHG
ncbi:LOW QUALITY PROTEIN: hypothetical protein I317_04186 [Kwoniella heveanensis CBS 569]|nr:LOW QUALITY PROTEIN: hypothetical protein I317_04186 [Kwoniella heveanensis CBS 569]